MSEKIIYNDKPRDPSKYYVESIKIPKKKRTEETLEGREILTLQDAAIEAAQKLEDGDPGMMMGGIRVHSKTNLVFAGQTQMGKSSVMKLHTAEILRRISAGSDEKVILFDSTGDIIPFVYGHVGDTAPVYILNPADERCRQWDIGADIVGASSITDASHTVIPSKPQDTEFFNESARGLLSGAMDSFHIAGVKRGKPIPWTLRDVALAVRTPQRMRAILGQEQNEEFLGHIIEAFLDRPNQDVYSSLQARMRELFTVAAMWHGRPLFSLRDDFIDSKQGAVLILSADRENAAVINELNRLIIERLAKMLLNRPEIPHPRYWFILDEFQELGKVRILKHLVKDGLKRGIRVLLSYQNVDDVRDTYEDKPASVLLSEAASYYLFRQGSEETAKHAAGIIGQRKLYRLLRNLSFSLNHQDSDSKTAGVSYQDTFSTTTGPNGQTQTTHAIASGWNQGNTTGVSDSAGISFGTQEQITFEPVVSAGAFQNLGLGEFYALTPTVPGTWKHRFDWRDIAPIVRHKSDCPEHAPLIQRDRKKEPFFDYLQDWTAEDLDRLGLPAEILAKKKPKPKKPRKTNPEAPPKAQGHTHEQTLTEDAEDIVRRINQRYGGG